RVELLEDREDAVADQTANGVRVGRVLAEQDLALPAEGLGLLAPDGEKRPDDAVLALHLDPLRVPARDKAVEDRLHLGGRGVPGGAEALGGLRVADRAQLRLARAARVELDDLRAELAFAETRIVVGLASAQPVVDVQGRDLVAELAERVQEAGRVGAARHEAQDLAARRDPSGRADVRSDPPGGAPPSGAALALSGGSPAAPAGQARPAQA